MNTLTAEVTGSSDSGKVYLFDRFGNFEYLIYDFSANIGDTLAVSYSTSPNSYIGGGGCCLEVNVTVDSTDYIFYASALRKILYLHSFPSLSLNFVWIEGIGGPGGFVSTLRNDYLNPSYFICMSTGGDQLWPSYEPSTICDTSLPVWGIYSDASVASDLYLSPNPAQDQVKTKLRNDEFISGSNQTLQYGGGVCRISMK
jgi:hypothetical protein